MSILHQPCDDVPSPAARARAIARAGGLAAALESGALPPQIQASFAEGLVLGLLRQGVRSYFASFGAGTTELSEVLRIYEEAGLTRTLHLHHPVAAAHAATALNWQYGERAAVVASIGPGALQALAGARASAANGIGVYHLYSGGPGWGNGARRPGPPDGFAALVAAMGPREVFAAPDALSAALARGAACVNHPRTAGPFFLLVPDDAATAPLDLTALPVRPAPHASALLDAASCDAVLARIRTHQRIVLTLGRGARGHDAAVTQFAETIGAAIVLSPAAIGVMPDAHPQNLHVEGVSCARFAMAEADLVLPIGAADGETLGVRDGDVGAIVAGLLGRIAATGGIDLAEKRVWLAACAAQKADWAAFKAQRAAAAPLFDAAWDRPCLTQPAAMAIVVEFAAAIGAAKLFDAGSVQTNGHRLVADDASGDTFSEIGASFPGFAMSALVAAAAAERPRYAIALCGDGSFLSSPQVLVDAVEHGARGMIVVFDNRRRAALGQLQRARHGREFQTDDHFAVDYVALAGAVAGVFATSGGFSRAELSSALERAHRHAGLSLVHVPVYAGDDPQGDLETNNLELRNA